MIMMSSVCQPLILIFQIIRTIQELIVIICTLKIRRDLLWEICEFGQKSFTPGGWLVYPSDLPVWPGKKTNRRPTVQWGSVNKSRYNMRLLLWSPSPSQPLVRSSGQHKQGRTDIYNWLALSSILSTRISDHAILTQKTEFCCHEIN